MAFGVPMLIVRAVVAFLALPAVVAGVAPALIVRGTAAVPRLIVPGIVLLILGISLLVWCVRDFFKSGRGTLAPWDPPKHLVVVGLYRFVRNPMYLAVLTIVSGWAVHYLSGWLAFYAAFLTAAFHMRVTLHEEPWLRRQFGEEWEVYARSTRRWLPHWPADNQT